MSKLNIFILNNLNNKKEEIIINKPKTYKELLKQLKQRLKNIIYEIFILDNNKIIINDENKYTIIEDKIFIKEINRNNIDQSIFSLNYDKLSESKKEILDEKYNCLLCTNIIKNEKPYLCYQCQKIFHEKCLKLWDKECKSKNRFLICPNCINELAIEKWNKKLDYEDNRKNSAILLNKINELKEKENKQLVTITKYENYINKTVEIFKAILSKMNIIHKTLKMKNDNILNKLINNYSLNIVNLDIKNISNVIYEELDIINGIINRQNQNNFNNTFYISKKNNNSNISKNENEKRNKINNELSKKVKEPKKDGLKNNINNIRLKINGYNSKLVHEYELKEGENVITLLIKNKLTNLSYMFYNCNNLKDISDLKYLYVKDVKNFEGMFYGCTSLSDIKSLQNWDVSKGINFQSMFLECSSLSDIKPIQNWNVSNVNNFKGLFYKCSALSDIKPLQHWNVSNSNNFGGMFGECSLLSDISPLQNWNVSNGINFGGMFFGCSSLSNIKPLQLWNVSKGKNFKGMFYKCSALSDIKPLQHWNVSNGKNFLYMFNGCSSLSDIKPLQNWNVSSGNNFNSMFLKCPSLSNINSLKHWKGFNTMFDDNKY